MIPTISEILNKGADQKSTFEIRLVLEFDDSFYKKVRLSLIQKVYDSFKFIPFLQKVKEDYFKASNLSLDRGLINQFMKTCSTDLFESVFDKDKLLNFAKIDLKVRILLK